MNKNKKKENPVHPDIINILKQLSIQKVLIKNALNKLSDNIILEKIDRLLDQKELFISEIVSVFDFNFENFQQLHKKDIDLQCQKVIIQFEDLFFTSNEEKLIAFIISSEKKLQKLYLAQTNYGQHDEYSLMILESQLTDSRRDMLELNELQNVYLQQ